MTIGVFFLLSLTAHELFHLISKCDFPLIIFTKKIHLNFFRYNIDFAFIGMVLMVAFLMNFGNTSLSFTLFNRCTKDFLMSDPIMLGLNSSLTIPSGSQAFSVLLVFG